MYFKDFTLYRYSSLDNVPRAINIGWLSRNQRFEKGEVAEDVLERLWDYAKISVVATRGFHVCDICAMDKANHAQRGGESLFLGTAEIRVISCAGALFAAPNMIYHYVADHQYQPPKEFTDVVTSGYDPLSFEYLQKLEKMNYEWIRTAVG